MEETKKKGFNTSSNSYTILYSVVIVVIVAFLLAFVSSSLKPQHDENVALDKKKQILAALNIRDIDGAEATNIYNKVVTADKIIDRNGEEVEKGEQGGTKAGFLCNSASMKEGKLALYVCNVEGETKYVIPVYGMGLWGGINGYIALNADKQTVYGVHFVQQGKHVFAEGKDGVALSVVKKNEVTDPSTQCDAVTGATLTCNGVSDMLKNCLGEYTKFLTSK